jgi:hypothetical protein
LRDHNRELALICNKLKFGGVEASGWLSSPTKRSNVPSTGTGHHGGSPKGRTSGAVKDPEYDRRLKANRDEGVRMSDKRSEGRASTSSHSRESHSQGHTPGAVKDPDLWLLALVEPRLISALIYFSSPSRARARIAVENRPEHRRRKGLNNRAENSHQPARRRERSGRVGVGMSLYDKSKDFFGSPQEGLAVWSARAGPGPCKVVGTSKFLVVKF